MWLKTGYYFLQHLLLLLLYPSSPHTPATSLIYPPIYSPLPRLVMLSWLTSLRWATLPWLDPDRGLSPSIDDQARRVASEIANCCRMPEVTSQRTSRGLSEVLHGTSSAGRLAQIPDFSGDEHSEQAQCGAFPLLTDGCVSYLQQNEPPSRRHWGHCRRRFPAAAPFPAPGWWCGTEGCPPRPLSACPSFAIRSCERRDPVPWLWAWSLSPSWCGSPLIAEKTWDRGRRRKRWGGGSGKQGVDRGVSRGVWGETAFEDREGRDKQKIDMLLSSVYCCVVVDAVMAYGTMISIVVRWMNWFGNWGATLSSQPLVQTYVYLHLNIHINT